ncbi:helix-turn-helix transcriptional regulator [Aerococcaceae bacterium zg-BR9]|uniref:helix-turn-helix domain-containing protein n=1 Tax=Aerococcaceae bacterium zg-1292 TaxID=2774330 RepID=UPI004064B064|nr:helix-turn-helix transcriptional regulator [Aerococcaceae bacterium zg-BR9]
MGKLLATRMRSRRKELKLSQAELAEGICEQTQISRIERDIDYSPGAELVYALAKRLKVPMDYFFDKDSRADSGALSQFRSVSRKFLEQRDYESLKYIYQMEIAKTAKLPLSDQLYLQWIESLILFNFDNKQSEAMRSLESLLIKYSEYDWEYLNISNSLLNFYFKTENTAKFKELNSKMVELFKETEVRTKGELEILIKCRYNFCRFLWLDQQREQAMQEIIDTIELCLNNNSLYCLADLYCLLGNVSEDFAQRDTVKQYYVKALHIYQVQNNDKLALKLEHFINETLG